MLETEAIEVPAPEGESEELDARPLPAKADEAQLSVWKGDVRSAAIAAAGGIVAGAATVAVVRATRATPRKRSRRRVAQRPANVVASRSFLVDVHLLGDR